MIKIVEKFINYAYIIAITSLVIIAVIFLAIELHEVIINSAPTSGSI